MKFNERIYGYFIFPAAVALAAASALNIISISLSLLFGAAFVIYSVPSFLFAFDSGSRGKIIFNIALFLTGIILVTLNVFEILYPVKIIFPFLLFLTGVVFLILHMENRDVMPFFTAGIIFAGLGIVIALTYDNLFFAGFINRYVSFLFEYKYIIILLTGLLLLLRRNKK